MDENRNEQIDSKVADQSAKYGKQAGKSAGKAGKFLWKNKKNMAKGGKGALKVAKIIVQALKAVVTLLINVFGIPLLIVIGVIILSFIVYEVIFGTRTSTQQYSQKSTDYQNPVAVNKKGYYVNTSMTTENRLVKAYYTVMSKDSYYIQTPDGKLIQGGTSEAAKYKDLYDREKMFYLNPNILWTLNQRLNKNKFIYVNQFLKPVDYNPKTFKLNNLWEKGKLVAKSYGYYKNSNGTYSVGTKKVPGVWDYGFAPVLKYKQFTEDKKVSGTYGKESYYNTKTGKVEWKSINESFNHTLPGYPKKVWMISDAVTAAGSVTNNITNNPVTTQTTLSPGTGTEESSAKIVECGSKTVDKWDWIEKPYETTKTEQQKTYNDKLKKYETKTVKVKETKYKKVWGKTGQKFTYTVKKMKTSQQATDTVPKYEGKPNPKNITGNKYFFQYMENYKTYVPENVMKGFDFEKLTGLSAENILNQPASTSSSSDDLGPNVQFKMGSGVTGGSYQRSAQYMPLAEQIGKETGFDPALIIATIANESSGDPNCDNGCAYGLMQWEYTSNPPDIKLHLANGSSVPLHVTKESLAGNIKLQIEAGVAEFQEKAIANYGNIPVTIQGYNYGTGGVRETILHYLKRTGKATASDGQFSSAVEKYIKSGDTAWLQDTKWYSSGGYKTINAAGGGTANYFDKTMGFYKSANGSKPWIILNGVKYIMGEQSKSVGIIGAIGDGLNHLGTLANQYLKGMTQAPGTGTDYGFGSWIESQFNSVKAAIDKIFTVIKYSNSCVPFSNVLNDKTSQTTVNLFFAMQSGLPYSVSGDVTDKIWKLRFDELFSNPIGQAWNNGGSTTAPTVDPTQYFNDGKFTSPVSGTTIIKKFGLSGDSVNDGIVVSATNGSKAYSVAENGLVTEVGSNPKIGKYVTIEYANNTYITIGNLSSYCVKKGDKVKYKQVVGTVGGTSTSALHIGGVYLSLQHDGSIQDPSWIVTHNLGGTVGGGSGNPNVSGAKPQLSNPKAQALVNAIWQYVGSPYSWGGKLPPTYNASTGQWERQLAGASCGGKETYKTGFDCSGFTHWAYLKGLGVNIGESTYSQVDAGTKVPWEQIQPGDLIFRFSNGQPEHVMIYIGRTASGGWETLQAPHTGANVGLVTYASFPTSTYHVYSYWNLAS